MRKLIRSAKGVNPSKLNAKTHACFFFVTPRNYNNIPKLKENVWFKFRLINNSLFGTYTWTIIAVSDNGERNGREENEQFGAENNFLKIRQDSSQKLPTYSRDQLQIRSLPYQRRRRYRSPHAPRHLRRRLITSSSAILQQRQIRRRFRNDRRHLLR